MTEFLLGSNTGRRSEDLSQPNLETSGLSELTVSAIGYNTVSHGGLKSYRRLLAEKEDKETSPLQTSDDETVRLQPMQNTTSSSPDGKLVASASVDKTVRLWDSATGAARRTLKGHSDRVWGVAFSPDGTLVASASADQTVRLWDSATGAARRTLKGHSYSVLGVGFSPDGTLVASASEDNTVRLWDSATGAARRTLEGHSDGVRGVAFSPDGTLVASASADKTVRLWSAATGTAGKYTLAS